MAKIERADELNAQRKALEELLRTLTDAGQFEARCIVSAKLEAVYKELHHLPQQKDSAEMVLEVFKEITGGVHLEGRQVSPSMLPVARVVAEMVVRSGWDSDRIEFYTDGAFVMFKAGEAGPVNLSGYNFARQLKSCLDVITEAGHFV